MAVAKDGIKKSPHSFETITQFGTRLNIPGYATGLSFQTETQTQLTTREIERDVQWSSREELNWTDIGVELSRQRVHFLLSGFQLST